MAGTFMEQMEEMGMESCLAPHLFEESKNFLRRNLQNHMNN